MYLLLRLTRNKIKIKINHYQMLKIFQHYHRQIHHQIKVRVYSSCFHFFYVIYTDTASVWAAGGTNTSEKTSATQQKKKSGGSSKKKFMEEIQAMPPPPSLSSTDDFPAFGLSELGRRLITEENEPTVTIQVKEEKPLPPPPSSSAATTAAKQEKKEEKKSTVQPNKKVGIVNDENVVRTILNCIVRQNGIKIPFLQVQKATKTNDSVTQEV
jgi:hypothetical protein